MRKTLYIILILLLSNCEKAKEMTQAEYLEKGKFIWQNFVPKSGQAKTIQGELLRAIEKLRDEAHRNGNGNFNNSCHKLLIVYLREKLNDEKIFNKETIKQINADLDKINIENQPYLEDDIFDRINDRIVDWFLFYGDKKLHENNAELNC
jgi:hypothetical protein